MSSFTQKTTVVFFTLHLDLKVADCPPEQCTLEQAAVGGHIKFQLVVKQTGDLTN